MKEQPTIADTNRSIAEFMGLESYEDSWGIWFKREGQIKCMHTKLQDLGYHKSWGDLMPVVEKIEGLGYKFQICRRRVQICEDSGTQPHVLTVKEESKLNSVYAAVHQFIIWYNSTHK